LSDIENDVFASYEFPRVPLDVQKLLADYQARTGHPLSEISDNALEHIQAEINAWNGTGQPVDELLDRIDVWLNAQKADAIGDVEVGNVLSQITLGLMTRHNIAQWIWRHNGKDVPCSTPITIAGNTYDGCLELDGKRFPLGAEMPPDASHPFCHCLPEPVFPIP
jgi:hypothetical protein